MSKIALEGNASGTGTFTLASPNSSTDRTLTLPDNTGTIITTASTFAGTGPAFSVYQTTAQTLSTATMTKIVFDTEEFDTANCFDSTTNYRFTPNVAGYYYLSGKIQPQASYSAGIQAIYKNGNLYRYFTYNANATGYAHPVGGCLVYFNGSTDYAELYASLTTGQVLTAFSNAGSAAFTWFQGHMVRAA